MQLICQRGPPITGPLIRTVTTVIVLMAINVPDLEKLKI